MPSPGKFNKTGRQPADASSVTSLTRTPVRFPAAWSWFVDEQIPSYVKRTYSPRESWKDKPFTPEDGRFFFRGIEELSELFTEERPRKLPAYFQHPKFRSGYLLYFLPLQAAKFLTLFHLHPQALESALEHGKKQGVIRITDLGAGPGTASIAFLLWLLGKGSAAGAIPRVEFHWLDTNRSILEDGKALALALAQNFPLLRDKVTIHTHVDTWKKAPFVAPGETSLVLFGHVLNEEALTSNYDDLPPVSSDDDDDESEESGRPSFQLDSVWPRILERASGGGVLLLEPATRKTSQFLSRLRDTLFESELVEEDARSIWGPCLHAGACPLSHSKDWCHFSVPLTIPGKWFAMFSRGLGSERQFAKFSYLWLSTQDYRAPEPAAGVRRVISDPLKPRSRDESSQVLLCEPGRPGRLTVRQTSLAWRGDLVNLEGRGADRPPFQPSDRPAKRAFTARPRRK